MLIVWMTWSPLQQADQMPPLGFEELKSLIRSSHTLDEVTKAIEGRGISFAPTEGIITQLKDEINERSEQYSFDLARLGETLQRHRPTELVVGIARFVEGNSQDIAGLSIAIRDYLDRLGESSRLVRIEPMLLNAEIGSDDSAFEAGNHAGVDLVVWGDWRRLPDGRVLFHPRVRVTSSPADVVLAKGDAQKRDYTLDPFAQGPGFNVSESAAIKTSNLVGILVALSFYNQALAMRERLGEHEDEGGHNEAWKRHFARTAEILKSLPDPDSEIYFYRGNCSYYLGLNKDAETIFKTAVSLNPTDFKSLHNLGTVQLALGKSNLQDAISNFKSALKINPNSDKTLNNLGVALLNQDEFSRQGFDYIEKAKTINPKNATAWYNYGAALFNVGGGFKQQDAREAFLEYLKLRPRDHATWSLCAKYWSEASENPQKTHQFISAAIESDPRMGEYFDRLVDILYSLASFGEEDINLSHKMLGLIPAGADSSSKKHLRERLLARIVRSEVELGHNTEAARSFSEIGIQETEFSDCADRLAYKLAAGQIPSINLTQPSLTKIYFATTYENFFDHSYRVDFSTDRKELMQGYESILKMQPAHTGALIGMGILHIQILRLPSRAWVLEKFVGENENIVDWAERFRNEGKSVLRRANHQIADPQTKTILMQCIGKLNHLPREY